MIGSSRSLSEIARHEAKDEITDYTVYRRLSGIEKDGKLRQVFAKIAEMEWGHYRFWMKYLDIAEMRPDSLKVGFVLLLRRIFGAAFVIKYLEGAESAAIEKYRALERFIPRRDRKAFSRIIRDEEGHEQEFANRIQGIYLKYISFVVLGLADALVEIAGIHAGSLGIYDSTFLTGLAGIIAGAAASLSMASAAFAQAKQGFEGSPRRAAAYTGISYFISAIILASPYFMTKDIVAAMATSLVFGVSIIAFVSWYNSIMTGSRFRKDFSELAGIMLGATAALFLLGLIIRTVFGITI
ncbi:MAG TPA: VIT1/CCC1 family protein [Candidatus Saccharimonadales bacterium]|nr:VIT1/CCC1 family protein [Candidatus Saccharimonadales bacterium]